LFGCLAAGNLPAALDLPTGLGKTAVMAIWLIARAHGARLPRRLIYVVDRRAVVDQATTEAQKLRESLDQRPHLKAALGLGDRSLPISTLRGQFVDNREWLADPATSAIIVGTVDMIGSRLLFSGYGVSPKMRSYHAGLMGADALVVLDEAHLVPPFEKLLEAIEAGADVLGPRTQECPRSHSSLQAAFPVGDRTRASGRCVSAREGRSC
jgi:CRISPR-associated endonuclease/helicase Cas3